MIHHEDRAPLLVVQCLNIPDFSLAGIHCAGCGSGPFPACARYIDQPRKDKLLCEFGKFLQISYLPIFIEKLSERIRAVIWQTS